MYKASARYYDAIYSFKNYEEEARKLDAIIQSSKPVPKRCSTHDPEGLMGRGLYIGTRSS